MAVNEITAYDRAMFQFFRLVKQECGRPVASVFATPQKAFAALSDIYSDDIPEGSTTQRIPLPATALHREAPTFDPTLFRFTPRMVVRYDDVPNHTKVKTMKTPQSITLDYVLEVWAYTQAEMVNLLKQLKLKFLGELAYIQVDLEEYGKHRFSVRDGGITDSSVLEPQGEERLLRATQSVTLSAVLLHPLDLLHTVLSVEVQYRDLDTDEVLSTREVTEDG